jgi:hypothetical protein
LPYPLTLLRHKLFQLVFMLLTRYLGLQLPVEVVNQCALASDDLPLFLQSTLLGLHKSL